MTEENGMGLTAAAPGAPQSFFNGEGANEIDDGGFGKSDETSVSTASTPERLLTNTNTNTNRVNVYNVNKDESKYDAVIALRIPVEVKEWLNGIHEQTGESLSCILRKIIIAAFMGNSVPKPYRAPTIILNYNVAHSESKPVINVGEYVALKQLNDLLAESRKLNARAEREQDSGQVLTFTRERAKALEEGLLKALKSLKSLDPQKLQEVEAALAVLKGIRGHRP